MNHEMEKDICTMSECVRNSCDERALERIKKALERNVPMKVIQTQGDIDDRLFDCPKCKETFYYEGTTAGWNYCMECGVALEWCDDV